MNRPMIESGEWRVSCSKSQVPRSKSRWVILGWITLVGQLVLLAACSSMTPAATPASSPGTGIAVAAEFQAFYDSNGGARIFGFPISTPIADSESGPLMQYFQHMRLEYDLVNQKIDITPFGEFYAPDSDKQEPAPPSQNGPSREFLETGFSVYDEFLTFYEANNGEQLFGPPITPQLNEGGTLVQYFRNVQLEWNPNAPPDFRVQVASLGDAHYWQYRPFDSTSGTTRIDSASVLEADVKATVKAPILYEGEQQVIYVTVITPDSLQLVERAIVTVYVRYGGLQNTIVLPLTDGMGQTQGALELPGVEPGEKVQVEVLAESQARNFLGRTTLSFKTWW